MKDFNDDSAGCDQHHTKFAPKKHPDFGRKGGNVLQDHKRAVGHPKRHTAGKFPSQLQPDHGPHG